MGTEPSWVRVAVGICDDIRKGRLEVGDRIPTDQALRDRFSLGERPVKDARAWLRSAGVATYTLGVGLFVARVPEPDEGPEVRTTWQERVDGRLDALEQAVRRLTGSDGA